MKKKGMQFGETRYIVRWKLVIDGKDDWQTLSCRSRLAALREYNRFKKNGFECTLEEVTI